MLVKVLSGAWLLILLVPMEARAADVSGKFTLKGEPGEGVVSLNYCGVTKAGTLQSGSVDGKPNEEESFPTLPLGGELTIKGSGKTWNWSVSGIQPGYCLVCCMFVPKKAAWNYRHATWKWVQLKDERDKATADLELDLAPDPKQLGAIEVDPPKDQKLNQVAFLPMDGVDPSSPAVSVLRDGVLGGFLPMKNDLKKPAATFTFRGVPPGKYRVFEMNLGYADVEVKAGETVTAELPKAEEKKK